MNSEKGMDTSCWHCSNWRLCYICVGDDPCRMALFQKCLQRVQAGQRAQHKHHPAAEEAGG